VPACQTPAKDGTVIVTNSRKVKEAQAATLEYLLLNHPLDCPVCDQAGECYLQDYSYRYGRAESRLKDGKLVRPDKDHIGANIALFTDRCVMCSRCVRFTREISGTAELEIINRGDHAEIDVFPGQPCNNQLAGNVVDLCPVGALCSKDFLYKQRVWFLKETPSVCPGCSTGCSIHIDQNKNLIYRLRPRANPLAQGYFMCDEGRFGYKYINAKERLRTPLLRHNQMQTPIAWDGLIGRLRREFEDASAPGFGGMAAVLSPWLTVEEAYLAATYFKGLPGPVTLALGPVSLVGEDDRYPKDVHGRPPGDPLDVKFTIRAEKCPNRRGVEAILKQYEEALVPFDALLPQIQAGKLKALAIFASSPIAWITDEQAKVLEKLSLLVVVDLLASPASARAKYVLPGGSFAEKDGTFVNHAHLAQALHRAIQSPGEARPEGRLLWELSGRRGLFHAPTLRQEVARAVPFFAALGEGALKENGVTVGQPAAKPSKAAGQPRVTSSS
jgi:NADH-quinone oxidoreductase subunit G